MIIKSSTETHELGSLTSLRESLLQLDDDCLTSKESSASHDDGDDDDEDPLLVGL